MSTSANNHAKGLALTALGGLTLTVDIPLIRLAGGDSWTILFLRAGTTLAMALIIWAVWRRFSNKAPQLIPGRAGLVVAALYGLGSVAFITGVYNTSTANLVFILAFNTMFAALLSWLFLKERPRPATLVAMVLMLLGVLIIVWDSIGTGQMFGNLMGVVSALCIASALTISRASGREMGLASLVGVVFPFALAAFMVSKTGLNVSAPWWIIFNGAVVMPISFFCLANGPKYLSSPEVAMFYLLETVLAPIWVWMIFAEVPSRNSLIGGAILIVTLIAHSLWQLHDGRRRRATLAVQHPA
ncbi:drug/metabolite transporter (DMT)-like permease [Mesorhizobium soli]|uniref:DMT family transporter n=1 Tax=Pseudaminobacter soli (ex Li et al. 2025) TaxID=1295366 RepID=UPI0024750DA9|nr:DMT family transporter [Mesorhizobium soli]MDH6232718.1 drug/metabolite transporter (DMT)-like permease [Mesorhizobium soli]